MRITSAIILALAAAIFVIAMSMSTLVHGQYPAAPELPAMKDVGLKYDLEQSATWYKLEQVWQHFVPPSDVEVINKTLGTKSIVKSKRIFGVYSVSHLPGKHANFNWPWDTTLGLQETKKTSKNITTKNFLLLPKANGKKLPVLIINEKPVKWVFPKGTTVGEVIYAEHEGKKYPQEIRTRTKGDELWEPGIYRPIQDRTHYERIVGKQDVYKRYIHLRNPQEDEVEKLEGMVDIIPDISLEEKLKILSLPFNLVPTDGEVWTPGADVDFHIYPKHYALGLINRVDSVTCSVCHRQTQTSVRNLVPNDWDVRNNPETIGNIRGCDGIFSWHPFDGASIKLRDYDIKNGNVSFEIPGGCEDRYKLTLTVQQALKDYELPPKQFLHGVENDQ